jgi:hypothetical protein
MDPPKVDWGGGSSIAPAESGLKSLRDVYETSSESDRTETGRQSSVDVEFDELDPETPGEKPIFPSSSSLDEADDGTMLEDEDIQGSKVRMSKSVDLEPAEDSG